MSEKTSGTKTPKQTNKLAYPAVHRNSQRSVLKPWLVIIQKQSSENSGFSNQLCLKQWVCPSCQIWLFFLPLSSFNESYNDIGQWQTSEIKIVIANDDFLVRFIIRLQSKLSICEIIHPLNTDPPSYIHINKKNLTSHRFIQIINNN